MTVTASVARNQEALLASTVRSASTCHTGASTAILGSTDATIVTATWQVPLRDHEVANTAFLDAQDHALRNACDLVNHLGNLTRTKMRLLANANQVLNQVLLRLVTLLDAVVILLRHLIQGLEGIVIRPCRIIARVDLIRIRTKNLTCRVLTTGQLCQDTHNLLVDTRLLDAGGTVLVNILRQLANSGSQTRRLQLSSVHRVDDHALHNVAKGGSDLRHVSHLLSRRIHDLLEATHRVTALIDPVLQRLEVVRGGTASLLRQSAQFSSSRL